MTHYRYILDHRTNSDIFQGAKEGCLIKLSNTFVDTINGLPTANLNPQPLLMHNRPLGNGGRRGCNWQIVCWQTSIQRHILGKLGALGTASNFKIHLPVFIPNRAKLIPSDHLGNSVGASARFRSFLHHENRSFNHFTHQSDYPRGRDQ